MALAFIFHLHKHDIDISKRASVFIDSAILTQKHQLGEANTGYKIYPERFYRPDLQDGGNIPHIRPSELLISYLTGFAYVLFAPFPWMVKSGMGLASLLQTWIYYLLIPFMFSGLILTVRYRWREAMCSLIFIAIILSEFALFQGNAGTLFRHRDTLMVFFLVFGAVGISNFIGLLRNRQFYDSRYGTSK